jgi:hypothetical protein
MPTIYTCPACRRRYTIYHDGEYSCECGKAFAHPPMLPSEKACFIQVAPLFHPRPTHRVAAPVNSEKRSFASALMSVLAMPLF